MYCDINWPSVVITTKIAYMSERSACCWQVNCHLDFRCPWFPNYSLITYHSLHTRILKPIQVVFVYWLRDLYISRLTDQPRPQDTSIWGVVGLSSHIPWQCRYSKVNSDIFLWGNLIHSAITAPGPLAVLSPRERRAHTYWKFPPPKKRKFALFRFHWYFGLEVNFKQRQIIAEKHLIVLMLFVKRSCTPVLSMLFELSSFCEFV